MSIFSRRLPFDRKIMLEKADRLQKGRRWRHALQLYRQVLAAEPRNAELHYRTAPLLARAKRDAEAWESFRVAAEAMDQQNEAGRHLRILRTAGATLPRNFEAQRALAQAERASQNSDAALEILLTAAERLARRRSRRQSILLLRDARQLAPAHPGVIHTLARRLGQDGQAAEALFLLDQLESRVSGEDHLRTSGLIWRIEPSLRHTWRYFTAWRDFRRQARPSARRARA
ncbi:MAG: hypothetical protein AB8G23_24420 [Myxococcota bacterium]